MSYKRYLKVQLTRSGKYAARYIAWRTLLVLAALPVFFLGERFGLPRFASKVISVVVALLVLALTIRWWRPKIWAEKTERNDHYAYVCESCKRPAAAADCVCEECGFNPEDSDAGVHLKRK